MMDAVVYDLATREDAKLTMVLFAFFAASREICEVRRLVYCCDGFNSYADSCYTAQRIDGAALLWGNGLHCVQARFAPQLS
jgi:hypothetical protein